MEQRASKAEERIKEYSTVVKGFRDKLLRSEEERQVYKLQADKARVQLKHQRANHELVEADRDHLALQLQTQLKIHTEDRKRIAELVRETRQKQGGALEIAQGEIAKLNEEVALLKTQLSLSQDRLKSVADDRNSDSMRANERLQRSARSYESKIASMRHDNTLNLQRLDQALGQANTFLLDLTQRLEAFSDVMERVGCAIAAEDEAKLADALSTVDHHDKKNTTSTSSLFRSPSERNNRNLNATLTTPKLPLSFTSPSSHGGDYSFEQAVEARGQEQRQSKAAASLAAYVPSNDLDELSTPHEAPKPRLTHITTPTTPTGDCKHKSRVMSRCSDDNDDGAGAGADAGDDSDKDLVVRQVRRLELLATRLVAVYKVLDAVQDQMADAHAASLASSACRMQ